MKKKILFLTRTHGYGGAEKHLIELVLRVNRSVIEPIILCFAADPYTERLADLSECPVMVLHVSPPGHFFRYWSVFRTIRPEIIVFNNGGFRMFPWYAYLAAHGSGARKVHAIEHFFAGEGPGMISGRGVFNRIRRLVGKRARARWPGKISAILTDRTICVSEAVRDRLVGHWGYSQDRTVTVRNGVDVKHFSVPASVPAQVGQGLGITAGDCVVLFIGRLVAEKGIDVLVDAVSFLSSRGLSLKCLIVGDGPDRGDLEKRARDTGGSVQFSFLGFQKDVRPYYWLSTIFVLPSYWEGLSLTLLEAMASGLPCIATDVGGNAEVVVPGVTGLLVKPGSSDELAGAIEYLVRNRGERERMGREGRKRVCEHFDLDKSVSRLISTLTS